MEFFGYKKCSTCRDAHKYLTTNGVLVEFQDFVVSPPGKEQLRQWVNRYGEGIAPFVNTKGTQYRAMGLKDRELSDEEWLDLLSQDGRLLKRPVLVGQNEILVGFDKEKYSRFVGENGAAQS